MRRSLCLILCLALVGSLSGAAAAGEEKLAALTFDDGPSGPITRRLLEGLAERDAKATFFLCGYRMELYPDMAGQILEEGHEIGLHGYSHDCLERMSPEDLGEELDRTAGLLLEQTGSTARLLRPPGGIWGERVCAAARERDLAVIAWSVDPRDWAVSDCAAVTRSILEHVSDGDIILMHDMSNSSVNAALETVDRLENMGYRFVTVSELARLRGQNWTPGTVYFKLQPGNG